MDTLSLFLSLDSRSFPIITLNPNLTPTLTYVITIDSNKKFIWSCLYNHKIKWKYLVIQRSADLDKFECRKPTLRDFDICLK
jgi:hypothetical protein